MQRCLLCLHGPDSVLQLEYWREKKRKLFFSIFKKSDNPSFLETSPRGQGRQAMFWRLGFAQSSPIETLLDSDDYTLQQLLDEDDLVQECKQLNNKLLDL